MADVLGTVTHYFGKVGVAVVKLEPKVQLKKGDHVQFKGHATDFEQDISSLQVEHSDVDSVKAGDDFGMKVDQKVREGDQMLAAGA